MILSRGSLMRYGGRNSQPPALLAGGVVAAPQGRPLVVIPRIADASFPHECQPGRPGVLVRGRRECDGKVQLTNF